MTSMTITLEKTLKWRDYWSQGDLRIIREDLATVGATSFRPIGKQYVACRNEAGRVVASIHPGYIEFPKASAPSDLAGSSRWRILSTFNPRDENTRAPLENDECCSRCFMKLSLSGVCGCDD